MLGNRTVLTLSSAVFVMAVMSFTILTAGGKKVVPQVGAEKRGQEPLTGTAQRVLRMNCTCPLFPAPTCGTTGKKKTMPAPADMDKAEALVKELYAKEFLQAKKNRADKAQLASLFLQEGRETRDYPAGRLVLLLQARDLAAEVGNIAVALQAIEELALSFPVGKAAAFKMKVETLHRASKARADKVAYRNVADAALILLEDALDQDDYEAALQLVRTAENAAIQLRIVKLVSQIRQQQVRVRQWQKEFDKIRPFVQTLRAKPKDATANGAVGKYYAFLKDNWKKGLNYLIHAKDPMLKLQAIRERNQSKSLKNSLDLAAGWRNVAKSLKGKARYHVLLRAHHWYQQAELNLKGKQHEKVAQAMQDIMDDLPPAFRIGEITRELRQFQEHTGPVFDVAFSPDGRKLVSGGQDGTVIVRDVRTGKIIRKLRNNNSPVWTVAFDPNGQRVLSAGFDKTLHLWDLASGQVLRTFSGHTDYVRAVTFSRDGQRILSAGDDRTLRLWDVTSGKQLAKLTGHNHYVWDVALSPNDRAFSASLDRTVARWSLSPKDDTLEPRKVLKGHTDTVLAVALSPNGRQLLSAGADKTLRLWDTATGQPLQTLTGPTGFVNTVAFAPDGRRALSGGYDASLWLWDLSTGKELRQLRGHQGRVWSVAFSRDGRLAASAGHDGTVRLWGGSRQ